MSNTIITDSFSRKNVIHKLKTGRSLRPRNLAKKLFILAGIGDYYERVKYSDGFGGEKKSRIVVQCTKTPCLELLLQSISKYVSNPFISASRTTPCHERCRININYSSVNWDAIEYDLSLRELHYR